jgi:pimeloyl-ACP methyl ester carboxylesterase
MKLNVNGIETYIATGGRIHVEGRPWIVLLHGAGFSHLVWVLQSRALAYDGWNVLAPDLPGHNLSKGEPIESIVAQAQWVLDLMDAAGAKEAVLVGHSQGGLIAMEAARVAPRRVRSVVFVGTAAAIPVNPALIETAETKEGLAFQQMTSWAYGPDAHKHDNTWPGASHVHFSLDTMGLNRTGALATDLKSCTNYSNGLEVARGLQCPTLCILAEYDRMTPLKSGLALAEALPTNETIVVKGSGHTLPTEKPREISRAICQFLSAQMDA